MAPPPRAPGQFLCESELNRILEKPYRGPALSAGLRLARQSSDDGGGFVIPTIKQIRDYAYGLWEKAGRPQGRDAEFWHAAAIELTERQIPDAPTPADQSTKP